ncbi:hypothetical protein [Pseudactinotalea terrae]|uniref:hypothetical protein n=1 Tax=Pseudactinotalea terrae TaxID=1743262 RepID=UPI0012E1505C|nr:hypothetical protein [Pseudactinotalea terrae]
MTQTLTRPENETEAELDDAAPPRRRVIELSFVQLVAGALAAMTSALIGSRIGVSGTVIGAAVGSLVAGVAGSVYTASLQRGRQVIARAPVALRSPTLVMRRSTAVLPTAAAVPPGVPGQAVLDARPVLPARRPRWKPVLAAAAAMFVLAALGITALELATGQSLSGRDGTTISQVSTGAQAQQQPLPQPPAEIPAEDPTEEASEDPGQSPSETPTEVPTEEGEPTDEPSETPSDIPTEEPTETPTEEPSETPSQEPTEDPSTPSTPESPQGQSSLE